MSSAFRSVCEIDFTVKHDGVKAVKIIPKAKINHENNLELTNKNHVLDTFFTT